MRCNPTPPDKLCDRPHMRPQQSQGFARALTNARAWLCRQACAVPRAAARRRCRGWPRCACWARRRPRAWPRAWRPWTSRACAAARAVTPLRRCWLAGRWRWRRRAARERGAQPSLVHRRAALAAPSAQRYALGRCGRSGRVAARAAAGTRLQRGCACSEQRMPCARALGASRGNRRQQCAPAFPALCHQKGSKVRAAGAQVGGGAHALHLTGLDYELKCAEAVRLTWSAGEPAAHHSA